MQVEDYIMTSQDPEEEVERLMLQVESDELVDAIVSPVILDDRDANPGFGSSFVEFGCGPAHISTSIAVKHPELEVTALDINPERVGIGSENAAECSNLDVRLGDVTDLAEPSNQFRYGLCRLVLEHIKAQQPIAMSEMYRVLEPGGSLILQSVDHGLGIHFPESAYLAEVKQKLHQVLISNNYDSNTGRFLKTLALDAGFVLDREPKIELYKLYSHPVSPKELRAYELKLQIGFPMFVMAFGDPESAKKAQQYLLDYVRQPDTLSYTILVTVVAKKPE